MTKEEIIKKLRDMARYPTVTLPRDTEALRNAADLLEQAQQAEPVAWSYWQSCLNDDGTQTAPWVHRLSKFKPSESIINKDIEPLYISPPPRQPLTDEEIRDLWIENHNNGGATDTFARAIEVAHGITKENT